MSEGRREAKGEQSPRDAVDWFVENESDPEPDPVTLRRWEAWSASPKNRADYAKIIRMREEARTLSAPPTASRQELLADIEDEADVATIVRLELAAANQRVFGRSYRLPASRPPVVRAASFALLAFAATWFFLFSYWASPTRSERFYVTAPGVRQELALPDGSRITLGGDTKLAVRFAAHVRTIELDHGEAFFRVQHDPQRPFVVHAAGGTTTAVGTAFEVRQYANRVQVWVREGAVEVAPLKKVEIDDVASQAVVPVRVARGEEITYDAQGRATTPRPADPRVTAAWSEGHLVPLIYHGRPLPEVIEDIQPYTRRRIMIDPAAADFQYSGIVKQEDVDAWIRDLSAIYPVEVIDCRAFNARGDSRGCSDPEGVFIRSRLSPHPDGPQSAHR
jgi:ferric-dicitrate binding protein FerR (iron transport regulator)